MDVWCLTFDDFWLDEARIMKDIQEQNTAATSRRLKFTINTSKMGGIIFNPHSIILLLEKNIENI